MTKKQLFGRAVEPLMWAAMSDAYGTSVGKYTEKQKTFLTGIVDGLYDIFESKISVKDLQEMVGDKDEVTNPLQEN